MGKDGTNGVIHMNGEVNSGEVNGALMKSPKDAHLMGIEEAGQHPPGYLRNRKKIKFLGFSAEINLATVPLKVTLFLYFGAMAAILPYLTIHMLAIGISISEAAIIYGVLPFTSFIGPPTIGFLADKLGQYKTVLIVATFLNALFHTLLLSVPFYSNDAVEANASIFFDFSTQEISLFPQSQDDCTAFADHLKTLGNTSLRGILSECISNPFDSWRGLTISPTGGGSARGNSTQCDIEQDFIDGALHLFCGNNSMDSLHQNITSISNLMITEVGTCAGKISNLFVGSGDFIAVECATNITYETGRFVEEGSNALTFWSYFLIRIVATIFMNSCFCLLDATTLAVVKNQPNAEYGSERIWTVLGTAMISPLAGLLVDVSSQGQEQTDYSAAFYVANVLFFFNIVAYFVIKLEVDKPEQNMLHDGLKLFKYPEVAVFLVMIFFMGNMWGFVESYLFVFLKEDLHAPNYLLGLTLTTGSLAGIPFLYTSEKIVSKVGRVNLIVISFAFYFIRFFGYSFVESPWWCFPFEAMEAFTYHLMWTAAATYCSVLAPKGLLATLMGIMGALHYSLGKGFGSFIGGYLIKLLSVREAFRYFGIAAGTFSFIYFLLNFFWLKKAVKKRNLKLAVAGENLTPGYVLTDANDNRNHKSEPKQNDSEASESMLQS